LKLFRSHICTNRLFQICKNFPRRHFYDSVKKNDLYFNSLKKAKWHACLS
jgi:hypothetical protein